MQLEDKISLKNHKTNLITSSSFVSYAITVENSLGIFQFKDNLQTRPYFLNELRQKHSLAKHVLTIYSLKRKDL